MVEIYVLLFSGPQGRKKTNPDAAEERLALFEFAYRFLVRIMEILVGFSESVLSGIPCIRG